MKVKQSHVFINRTLPGSKHARDRSAHDSGLKFDVLLQQAETWQRGLLRPLRCSYKSQTAIILEKNLNLVCFKYRLSSRSWLQHPRQAISIISIEQNAEDFSSLCTPPHLPVSGCHSGHSSNHPYDLSWLRSLSYIRIDHLVPMSDQRIVRLARSDPTTDSTFALVHVKHSGSHPLDLKLLASEGENAYAGSSKYRPLTCPLLYQRPQSLHQSRI
jgi:hypothetical protein